MSLVALARARFDGWFGDSVDPAWSSTLLQSLIDDVDDDDAILSAFADCIAERWLTRSVAHLIEDVCRALIVRRASGDRRFLVERALARAAEGQPNECLALLAAWAVPTDTWLDGEAEEVLHVLLGTAFHDEAKLLLLDGEVAND